MWTDLKSSQIDYSVTSGRCLGACLDQCVYLIEGVAPDVNDLDGVIHFRCWIQREHVALCVVTYLTLARNPARRIM